MLAKNENHTCRDASASRAPVIVVAVAAAAIAVLNVVVTAVIVVKPVIVVVVVDEVDVDLVIVDVGVNVSQHKCSHHMLLKITCCVTTCWVNCIYSGSAQICSAQLSVGFHWESSGIM
jgi:hypothetical protein